MPFTKNEAREWAKHLNEIEAKAVELETLELVKDIREAIGRDAEEAGFYGEWIDMWAEPAKKADPEEDPADPWEAALATMRERAKRLPLLPSDHAHETAFMAEVGRIMLNEADLKEIEGTELEIVPMTVPELIGVVIDKIEKAADEGTHFDFYGVNVNCWPTPLEKDLLLTKSDCQRVADFFSDFGFSCTVESRRNALSSGWMVKIAW